MVSLPVTVQEWLVYIVEIFAGQLTRHLVGPVGVEQLQGGYGQLHLHMGQPGYMYMLYVIDDAIAKLYVTYSQNLVK